jgi:SAM-dependent methyltransferase
MEREAGVSGRRPALVGLRQAARLAVVCLAACLALQAAQAQPVPKAKKPLVGQEGKDAIWVPTPNALIDAMLDLAKITPQDKVVDLGSGDGRAVIAAAKRGASARGIEFDGNLVAVSRINATKEGVSDKATFEQADMFATDFSDATVVVLFLLPQLNEKLRPSILNMRPGTRVVSNTFEMGGWFPDEVFSLKEECDYFFCKALLWIVPAKVDGDWRIGGDGVPETLSLKQQFQTVTGTITNGGVVTAVAGRLRGDRLTFTAGATEYTGTVRGDLIDGTTKSGTTWQAKRGN